MSSTCGWCCDVGSYTVNIGSWSVVVFNASVSFALLAMMIFIVIKLHTSYMRLQVMSRSHSPGNGQWQSMNSNVHLDVKSTLQQDLEADELRERGMVRPLYYGYSLFACFWFVLEAMALLLPQTDAANTLSHILYQGHTFLDNIVIIFAFFRVPNRNAIISSIGLALFITLVKGAGMVAISLTVECSVCSLFFPVPQSFYAYLFNAIAYFIVLMLMFTRPSFPLRPRQSVFFWTLFLMVFNGTSSVGAALYLFLDVGAGFCVINVVVAVYALIYAPLLYTTFVRDSKQLREEKQARHLAETTSNDPTSALAMAKMLLRRFPGIPWIDIADIRKGPRIGIGASAEVYSGLWQGTPVAVKRLYADRAQSLEDFFREITVMSNLTHPNIVLLMGIYVDALGDRFIVTEYMDIGSVYDLLHPPNRPSAAVPRPDPPSIALSPFRNSSHAIHRLQSSASTSSAASTAASHESTPSATTPLLQPSASAPILRTPVMDRRLTGERVLVVLQHTARAIAYLHAFDPPILHRDLKTHNLLVGDGWVVKVADFGLSRSVSSQTMTAAGTPQWSAPEVIRQDRYTEKADVFSFGIVIYELLTARIPYQNMPAMSAAHAVAFEGLRPVFPKGLPLQYVDLAKLCWEEAPEDRPSFEELVSILDTLPPPDLPYLDENGNVRPLRR